MLLKFLFHQVLFPFRWLLLKGLDKYLSDLVLLPVYIAEDPLLAVANGTGKVLDEIEIFATLDE